MGGSLRRHGLPYAAVESSIFMWHLFLNEKGGKSLLLKSFRTLFQSMFERLKEYRNLEEAVTRMGF